MPGRISLRVNRKRLSLRLKKKGLHMINLLNEYELAFGELPNEPKSNQVLYVENHRNAELELYITTNLEEIKKTFESFGLEFIYLPEFVDSMTGEELKNTASYYVPWLKPTDLDTLRSACKIAINELYNKVHLKNDVPAIVNNRGRAFMVDVPHPRHYFALFYQIAAAYCETEEDVPFDNIFGRPDVSLCATRPEEHEDDIKPTLFTVEDYKFFEEREEAEYKLSHPKVHMVQEELVLKNEFARADRMYEELKKTHRGWVLEALFAEQQRKDEIISKIVIQSPRKLILPDYNSMEIKMAPATMAFYLLYLKHPEGIKFKDLVNYRKELYRIYSYTTKSDDKERITRTVDRMVDQLNGSQDEHRSRIKEAIDEAFTDQMCEKYARLYYLDGTRGEPMKIEIAKEKDKIDWTKADL